MCSKQVGERHRAIRIPVRKPVRSARAGNRALYCRPPYGGVLQRAQHEENQRPLSEPESGAAPRLDLDRTLAGATGSPLRKPGRVPGPTVERRASS